VKPFTPILGEKSGRKKKVIKIKRSSKKKRKFEKEVKTNFEEFTAFTSKL